LDSRSPGEVLGEAEALVDAGVRELAVVAQDTSAYGVDVRYRTDFWGGRPVKTRITELARELGDIAPWLRLHYIYPYPHVDELVELMAEERILPYLDIPLQHASPSVLKAMKRPASAENALARIRRWRETCPDLTLRSTFIVGFPGETEADFEQLLEFVAAAEVDRAGAFAYSPVAGAPANQLPDPVPDAVKADRLERLMALQAGISAARLARRIGRTEVVLVDSVDEDGTVYARSAAEAPEVDGHIAIDDIDPDDIAPGDFIEATITGADEHDLTAQLAD
ncbi:MAG: radical SAM protein, partial [Thiohalospira sp.]